MIEELEYRLAAETGRRDRLSGVPLELVGRPGAVERNGVELGSESSA